MAGTYWSLPREKSTVCKEEGRRKKSPGFCVSSRASKKPAVSTSDSSSGETGSKTAVKGLARSTKGKRLLATEMEGRSLDGGNGGNFTSDADNGDSSSR